MVLQLPFGATALLWMAYADLISGDQHCVVGANSLNGPPVLGRPLKLFVSTAQLPFGAELTTVWPLMGKYTAGRAAEY